MPDRGRGTADTWCAASSSVLGCSWLRFRRSSCFFSDFLLTRLTFRGIPIIFFKGDLEGTFAAAGSILFFALFERRRSWWALALTLVLAGIAVESNNRASMLGLIVAAVIVAAAGRRRFAILLGSAACAATLLSLALAFSRNQSWHRTPVYDAYERIASLADPSGTRSYTGEETFNKGDNNVFRSLWWRTTIGETLATNPWIGLGWGYDLAAAFERIYYPEGNDEFAARSPHNIFVTLFARTGVLGFIPFIAVTNCNRLTRLLVGEASRPPQRRTLGRLLRNPDQLRLRRGP